MIYLELKRHQHRKESRIPILLPEQLWDYWQILRSGRALSPFNPGLNPGDLGRFPVVLPLIEEMDAHSVAFKLAAYQRRVELWLELSIYGKPMFQQPWINQRCQERLYQATPDFIEPGQDLIYVRAADPGYAERYAYAKKMLDVNPRFVIPKCNIPAIGWKVKQGEDEFLTNIRRRHATAFGLRVLSEEEE